MNVRCQGWSKLLGSYHQLMSVLLQTRQCGNHWRGSRMSRADLRVVTDGSPVNRSGSVPVPPSPLDPPPNVDDARPLAPAGQHGGHWPIVPPAPAGSDR